MRVLGEQENSISGKRMWAGDFRVSTTADKYPLYLTLIMPTLLA